MRITSDIYKPSGLFYTSLNTLGYLNRPLLICLIVVLSQPIGAKVSHADELVQPQNDIVDQDESKQQRMAMTSASNGSITESLSADSRNEVHCLALNIYFEARSEPEIGQRAVAHVVMNRVAHPGYPDSVCQVVQQGGEQALHRCQFSWWCDGGSDKPANQKAWGQSLRLARQIYLGILKDTTDAALWYHASYVKPYWSKALLQGDKIGQHIFYLQNQRSRNTM